ncbi:MAG: hypothetical protein K9K30_16180 [Burkholderiaceae bacterium]|nr:hypothetical protein [Burkholderiaceae bacterium]
MLIKAKTLSGYKLDSLDGDIGKVREFYFDDRHWTIRYLVADTGTWLTGRQVLVSPQWIERVSWDERKVFVNLDREAVKQSPEYQAGSLLDRDYEIGLHGHYNRKGYWVDEPPNS